MYMYEDAMEPVAFMEKTKVPDGEGGFFNTYVEGSEFKAMFSVDSTPTVVLLAEQKAITGPYRITVRKGVALAYPDIVKRLSNGQYFRITSDSKDTETPSGAGLQLAVVTAEKLSKLPST